MTFFVIAKDGTDPEAAGRRQRVREQHLADIRPRLESGQVVLGGALLNDAGEMIGSGLVAEFGSREDLDAFLQGDIYTREGVWRSFEVYAFKRTTL